jgi:anti-anti-sigma factor
LIDVDVRPQGVVVTINEEHLSTAIIAELLYNELLQVILAHRPALLVLDCRQVKLITSSSLGTLLMVRKRLADYGGRLHLCSVSLPIVEACKSLGLTADRLLIFPTVEAALHTRVVESDDEREVMED